MLWDVWWQQRRPRASSSAEPLVAGRTLEVSRRRSTPSRRKTSPLRPPHQSHPTIVERSPAFRVVLDDSTWFGNALTAQSSAARRGMPVKLAGGLQRLALRQRRALLGIVWLTAALVSPCTLLIAQSKPADRGASRPVSELCVGIVLSSVLCRALEAVSTWPWWWGVARLSLREARMASACTLAGSSLMCLAVVLGAPIRRRGPYPWLGDGAVAEGKDDDPFLLIRRPKESDSNRDGDSDFLGDWGWRPSSAFQTAWTFGRGKWRSVDLVERGALQGQTTVERRDSLPHQLSGLPSGWAVHTMLKVRRWEGVSSPSSLWQRYAVDKRARWSDLGTPPPSREQPIIPDVPVAAAVIMARSVTW